MVDSDLDSVMMLLSSDQERIQLACLQVLAAVAFESQVRRGQVAKRDSRACREVTARQLLVKGCEPVARLPDCM